MVYHYALRRWPAYSHHERKVAVHVVSPTPVENGFYLCVLYLCQIAKRNGGLPTLLFLPGCLPAGVDPNLEAKRGRGSTKGERYQRDATGVTWSVSSSAPMVFTVQALLSLHPELSVPTATANRQHRLGKRREREAPASKHQIRPGNGSRTGRRGSGMPNPHRENKISGANGDSPSSVPLVSLTPCGSLPSLRL